VGLLARVPLLPRLHGAGWPAPALPHGGHLLQGPPYRHFIGLFTSASPFFEEPVEKHVLIDGLLEKEHIAPEIRGGLLLDTPSPVVRGNELWLYYAVSGEQDRTWRTALSIFSLPEESI